MTGRPGVAIIGMACRFPGAPTVDAYWELLRSGRETIRRFTVQELRDAGIAPAMVDDPRYVRARGMLDDVDQFDAGFFGISPREASQLDPQHRLWLECAWEAMEDAGYHGATCGQSVGVFAGCRISSYLLHNLCTDRRQARRLASAEDPDAYQMVLGNDKDLLATRTSYLLDLQGPSVVVQTACSSSLVAVAQACQSLLAYQSDMCLAGGACVMVPSIQGYRYQESGTASPDGHCRAFDARSQGTVFSDGVGAVLLKRADDAVADGDAIYAVIRGFAVNNDGRGKVSFAAPSIDGQARVVALAQAVAGVDPRSITYVEAHGTGTALGDPIEVAALTKAFRLRTEATAFCGIGSVKTNIGHADAAAGIAGLMKSVLALERRQIPPTLHFETANPAIDFERSPFFVVRELLPWESNGSPRRAGVSSLGVGGTNCHVVLEEAPPVEPQGRVAERSRHLLTLSARSETALREMARRYAGRLSSLAEEKLPDVCYTTNTGRARFRYGLAVPVGTMVELRDRLAAFADSGVGVAEREDDPAVAFLFTGQGAHYPGMGRDLYATEPVFRGVLERGDAILRRMLGHSLIDVLYRDPAAGTLLDRADYAQPALFAVQVALSELWRSWGIVPDVVLGHSIGELAAACTAGAFGLEDGLWLAAERGRLMHALPDPGVMAVVFAPEEQVVQVVASWGGAVSIAAVNGPGQVVVSGDRVSVDAVLATLRANGVEHRLLQVSHAFHSPVMEPVLDDVHRAAAGVRFSEPRVDFVSTVTGTLLGREIAGPSYWRDHVRRTVRFTAAVETLEKRRPALLLEIGPHPVLLGLARLCSPDYSRPMAASLSRHRPDREVLLESLGTMHQAGVAVDWRAFDAPYHRRRVHLPTYPFERRRHWVEPPGSADPPGTVDSAVSHPLLGRRLSLPFSPDVRFETRLSPGLVRHLDDHRLFGTVVFAASSALALFLSAAEAAFGSRPCVLEDMAFLRPLVLSDDLIRVVQAALIRAVDEQETFRLQLLSRAESSEPHAAGAWTLHATGRLRLAGELPAERVEIQTLRPPVIPVMSGHAFYGETWGPGPDTGPAFRCVETISRWDNEALALAASPGTSHGAEPYPLPPGVIEAAFQTLFFGGSFETRALVEQGSAYVPFTIDRFAFHGAPSGDRVWCHGRARESYSPDASAKSGDVRLIDDTGRIIAEIGGFTVRRLRREAIRDEGPAPEQLLYRITWEPDPLATGRDVMTGDWLVSAGSPGADEARLAALLTERGGHCRVMSVREPGALRALIQRRDRPLLGILYLSNPDPAATDTDCQDLLRLAQTLAAEASPPRLWLLTRRSQAILPGEAMPGARQAALWGMGRVIARELPTFRFTSIDLDEEIPEPAALLDEAGQENEIGFRQGRRYVPRLVPYTPPTRRSKSSPVFRGDLTYLVTDGFSSQGQAVAEWLVSGGARHLILMTRGDATAPSAALEPPGQSVSIVRMDLEHPDAALRRLHEIVAMMPPLGGIIHLDLAMEDGVLVSQTPERLSAAMAGAALGWALHQETRALPLDFFVCFSTSAAVLGTPGQSTYAAAGASLDALTLHRRQLGLPGLSVNWGPWREVGRAATLSPDLQQRLRCQGFTLLPTDRALDVLGSLVGCDIGQVAVLPIAWATYLGTRPRGEPTKLFERLAACGAAKPRLEEQVGESAGIPDSLVGYLRHKSAEVLGIPVAEVVVDKTLTDLGLDSLGAMMLANRIRHDLGKSVSISLIIEAANLHGLSEAIAAIPAQPSRGQVSGDRWTPRQ